jgi:hypothetical protein
MTVIITLTDERIENGTARVHVEIEFDPPQETARPLTPAEHLAAQLLEFLGNSNHTIVDHEKG